MHPDARACPLASSLRAALRLRPSDVLRLAGWRHEPGLREAVRARAEALRLDAEDAAALWPAPAGRTGRRG